jgi:IS66 C-terminal element
VSEASPQVLSNRGLGRMDTVYLTDLLTRLVNGWPQSRIDELMPWHWAPETTG